MEALAQALRAALAAPGRRWLTIAAALGVAASTLLPAASALPALCGMPLRAAWGQWDAFLGPVVTPASLALAWLVMLLAMMPPLLGEPLRHLWFSSLPGRRPWSAALFATSYTAVWMLVAPALLLAAWASRDALGGGAVPAVACFAFAWSSTPWTQRARNLCHRACRIGASGLRADAECIACGARYAARCVTVCWPWMMLPLLVEGWHVLAMVAVALWLMLDRICPPRPASWQWPPAVEQCRSMSHASPQER